MGRRAQQGGQHGTGPQVVSGGAPTAGVGARCSEQQEEAVHGGRMQAGSFAGHRL